MKDFKNKVAVITGAGSGMGRELAIQFVERGAKVAINDWNKESLAETLNMINHLGGKGKAYHFDVSDKSTVHDFSREVIEDFGQVDIVINNAGFTLPAKSIELTEYDDFEKLMGVNMWGVIYGSKAFLPYLKKRPDAVLMNTSSVFGIFGYPTQGPYCTAKFAVRGFTETLRLELELEGVENVKVCCIHPGGIQTGIVKNIDHSKSNLTKSEIEEAEKNFQDYCPTTASEAASQIIRAIERQNPKLLIGRDAKFMDFVARLFPTSYSRFLLKDLKTNEKAIAKAFAPDDNQIEKIRKETLNEHRIR
tara:strand:+ start:2306 stop:3223 length:918 start_codon:yes stop_codon:yes gene_type:complete